MRTLRDRVLIRHDGTPERFVEAMTTDAPDTAVRVLAPGQPLSISGRRSGAWPTYGNRNVCRKRGFLRARVACSNAKAYLISLGSLQARPMNVTPTGSSANAWPAGTEIRGEPASAAGVELPPMERSPLSTSIVQAGLRLGAKSASRF